MREVYLGPGCKEALDSVPRYPPRRDVPEEEVARQLERDKDTFISKCLAFYVRAQELQQQLPLNDPIFKEMAFIDPAVLLSQSARSGSDALVNLPMICSAFKVSIFEAIHKALVIIFSMLNGYSFCFNFYEKLKLDSNSLASEWRKFPNIVKGTIKDKLLNMTVEDAWVEIGLMRNGREEPMFPQLTKLANVVMILPHLNAHSERVFSVVTDVCTKKRNRLTCKTLNAVCVSRVSFRSKGIDCTSFKVSKDHLVKHNITMYARKLLIFVILVPLF